jgi:hypothetical protein
MLCSRQMLTRTLALYYRKPTKYGPHSATDSILNMKFLKVIVIHNWLALHILYAVFSEYYLTENNTGRLIENGTQTLQQAYRPCISSYYVYNILLTSC